MTYRFQHRQCTYAEPPLKPGVHKLLNEYYDVERAPRVGEKCTDYIKHVKQTCTPIRATFETFIQE